MTIKKSFECITSQKLHFITTIQMSVCSANNSVLKYSCRGVIKLPHLPLIKKCALILFLWYLTNVVYYFYAIYNKLNNKCRLLLNNI